jgi:methyl-accepting chemotaxis protein
MKPVKNAEKSGYFQNLGLKTKIGGGFLAVLLLLGLVGGISVLGFGAISRSFQDYSDTSRNTSRLTVIDRDLTELRRQAVGFIFMNDESAVGQFRTLSGSIKQQFADVTGGATNPERKAKLEQAGRTFDGFAANFENIVKAVETRNRLNHDKLEPVQAATRKNISEIIDSAMADNDMTAAAFGGLVQEQNIAARLWTVRYFANPDAKSADLVRGAVDKATKNAQALIDKLPDSKRKQLAAELLGLFKTYDTAFGEVAEATAAIEKISKQGMALQSKEMAVLLKDVRDAQFSSLQTVAAATRELAQSRTYVALGLSIGAFVLGALLAWLIGRALANPVVAMTGAMKKLAAGDTTVDIPARGRGDEIGQMANAVEVFKQNMVEADRLRGEQANAEARSAAEKKAAMNKMADEFERSVKGIVQKVSTASGGLQSTAQSMASTADQTQKQSTAVAAASEQASANVQTVASAAEELSSSILEIGRQVSESTRITTQAVRETERTNAQIQGLAEAAQRIGDVVKLISDIAGQTNLLALNATIEAARAGEAGKGFAVVASEVKSLATQTAKATEEISTKIAEMQTATGESVKAVQTIGETIGRINEIATTVAAAVEEQGAATKEIARNVQQASAGTAEVSTNITGVTKAAGETGAAASEVLGAAGELSRDSATLRAEVDAFIGNIRAA